MSGVKEIDPLFNESAILKRKRTSPSKGVAFI